MTTFRFTTVIVLVAIIAALPSVAAALTGGFLVDPARYPSPSNPNFLPNGTLVKSATKPQVFYLKDGKKSWIMESIVAKWLQEAHYFAPDTITVISDEDLARYPQTRSVNPYYIGKILQGPDGKQFFIDDKLRKRPISAAVRGALRFPANNRYLTSAAHISEFTTGAAITRTDIHPGGTVMYNGLYHGGTVWRIEENSAGVLTKRLYLQDYIYETEGYPWSSQIMSVSDTELAKYTRGSNIERYPDGWVVAFDGKVFVVQKGALRHITSPTLLNTLGYNHKYILTVFPEFLRRYPRATSISAFKNIVDGTQVGTTTTTTSTATSTAYPELRPAVRTLISQINDIFLVIYDRQITPDENRFWLDYVYKGEVQTKDQLVAAMQRTKSTGVKPSFTSRTATLDPSILKSKWFPYLFYFVWRQEPSTAAKEYWYSRIVPGDRDTIEKLGGTIQWLKQNENKMYR